MQLFSIDYSKIGVSAPEQNQIVSAEDKKLLEKLFDTKNIPSKDLKPLAESLKNLNNLPTGKQIVAALEKLTGKGKKIEIRPKIEGQDPVCDLDKDKGNLPYIRDLEGLLKGQRCCLLGSYNEDIKGYQICRGEVPSHIVLGHELIHLVDGLNNPEKFTADPANRRTVNDWEKDNEKSELLELRKHPRFDTIWGSKNNYEELMVNLGVSKMRTTEGFFTENKLLLEAGIGFRVGYSPNEFKSYYEDPKYIEILLKPYDLKLKDVGSGKVPTGGSFNPLEAKESSLSFFCTGEQKTFCTTLDKLTNDLSEVSEEKGSKGNGPFEKIINGLLDAPPSNKKEDKKISKEEATAQKAAQKKQGIEIAKFKKKVGEFKDSYSGFTKKIKAACYQLPTKLLAAKDISLAYEINKQFEYKGTKEAFSKLAPNASLGLITYESFYDNTGGNLLLKVGDGKQASEAIKLHSQMSRSKNFLEPTSFQVKQEVVISEKYSSEEALTELKENDPIETIAEKLNISIQLYTPDGTTSETINAGKTETVSLMQDGEQYFLVVDPPQNISMAIEQLKITDSKQTVIQLQQKDSAQTQVQIQMSEQAVLEMQQKDLNASEANLQNIKANLPNGYAIQDVKADGNCGFYAILQGLNSKNHYENVLPNSEEWNAVRDLRQQISKYPGLDKLEGMCTSLTDSDHQQLGADALPAVAQHYQRPVVMIDSVSNTMTVYKSDGQKSNSSPITQQDLKLYLSSDPIVLLSKPGHW